MTDMHVAIALMVLGVIGSIVPLLPGPPLVWLGATYYAYRTNWAEVSIPTVVVLAVIAVVASTSDIWLSALGARKTGASGWATVASIVGSIVGLLVASLPGLFIGAIGAIVAVEYYRHKDWDKVIQASKGYLGGYLLSLVVQVISCFLMIGIFIVALRS